MGCRDGHSLTRVLEWRGGATCYAVAFECEVCGGVEVVAGVGPRLWVYAQWREAKRLAGELVSEIAEERGGHVSFDPAHTPGLVFATPDLVLFKNA
jgi:hypothetical protein